MRGEGNEDGSRSGSQCALDGNEIICQRQAAHKALFLQIIQTVQSAVELLSDASSLKHSTIQLLLGLGRIEGQGGKAKCRPLTLAIRYVLYFVQLRIAKVKTKTRCA